MSKPTIEEAAEAASILELMNGRDEAMRILLDALNKRPLTTAERSQLRALRRSGRVIAKRLKAFEDSFVRLVST